MFRCKDNLTTFTVYNNTNIVLVPYVDEDTEMVSESWFSRGYWNL